MKKILKWTLSILLTIFVGLIVLISVRQNRTFEAPLPPITVSKDSAIIARGEYLFYGPAHCLDCHVPMNEIEQVELGMRVPPSGGRVWHLPIGVLTSANITSDLETGIGKMTDGEIARSLRYGVDRNGRAMVDFMPFHNTSDEDLIALLSYVRTIPPVKNSIKPFEYTLLGRIINAFVLKPVGPDGEVPVSISRDTSVEYGKYLATSVANCKGCHTNRDLKTGEFIGVPYAGGFHMPIDGKEGEFVVTCNLTPDPETGRITSWTQDRFISRFRQGKMIKESHMPWGPFKSLSDNDLKAIYGYLKSLKPVKNETGPTLIKES